MYRKIAGFVVDSIKFIWLSFWLAAATLLVVGPILLASLWGGKGNFAFNMSRVWAWIVLKAAGATLSVRGRENADRSRSYIIISNHQSHFDAPALALGLGLQFRWIAKKELLKVPLFGRALYSSKNIFIDRSNREMAIKSIREGVKRLPGCVSVMCFAEGTRSDDGRVKAFKKGGFVAAIEHGLPILPVAVNGSSRVLAKRSLVFHPGPIEIVIGTPLETGDCSLDRLEELMGETRDVIISMHSSG